MKARRGYCIEFKSGECCLSAFGDSKALSSQPVIDAFRILLKSDALSASLFPRYQETLSGIKPLIVGEKA